MRIIVRSNGINLWLPIPLCLASAAVFLIPTSSIENIRESVPAPYRDFITKPLLAELVRDCRDVLSEYHGLEIVHVEASDNTYVSIKL